MTKNTPKQAMLRMMLAITTLVTSASAQESVRTREATQPPVETGQVGSGGYRLPEAEFVGSPSFRSASLVQPFWRDLTVDGHYFGGDENNVGFAGGSWTFQGESW